MRFFKRIVIAQHERGLLFRDRNLETILEPGVYHFMNFLNRVNVHVFDLHTPEFKHESEDILLKQHAALCAQHFQVIELTETEVGLVYKNGVLSDILPPATRQFYWQGLLDIGVEIVDVSADYQLDEKLARIVTRVRDTNLARKLTAYIVVAEIPDDYAGLLLLDGLLIKTLAAGIYVYWRCNRSIKVEMVDKRMQIMEVSGQEILTRDKVSLRINLSAAYQIDDPVKARHAFKDVVDYLYREMQFGLRQAVAVKTLDNLLADKGATEAEIFHYVSAKIEAHGITLKTIGIKDVILPGDMKEILNRVVEAEKVSQANVIKRREETAATRSMLNTAKLMDENPTLLRLKELEVLEKVTEKVDRLTVFGGLEGVLKDTVKINV